MPVHIPTQADRCHEAQGDLSVYVDYVLETLLPTFNDIEQKAEEVAEAYLTSVNYKTSSEDGEVERGVSRSISSLHVERMERVRQTMLNLAAVGLFHRLEQLLSDIVQNAPSSTAETDPKKAAKTISFCGLVKKLEKHEPALLKRLPWSQINELRLVANVAKHAEGTSAKKLHEKKPNLFGSRDGGTGSPLLGEELFLFASDFKHYAEAADSLLKELPQHFEPNGELK